MRGSSPAHGRDIVARSSAEVIGTSVVERTGADEALEPEQELMTVNLGPHHPATHGVLRLLVSLQGETVIDLKPIMGYVHTGIEKNCEDKSYWKAIPFVERMDYLSYFFNMQAFCGCVEKMLDLEIPPRAKYLRVIHMELNRLHSHLVWLGTSALDLGAMSMFFYCFRDRDRILDLFEMSTGQRMHTRYFQVGGVFEDIPVGFERKVKAFCAEFPTRIDQFEALLTKNEIFLQRTKGVGIVDRERLKALGVTGPLLRAAGEPWDLRKVDPCLAYGDFDFDIPIGTVGDGWDRFRCRIQEMRESVRIIEQAIDGLPEGPVLRRRPQDRAAAAPRALDLDGGADPPLQARHRGLPGPARRVLLPDRVAARRARLLHPGRRLGEAGARPLPRPVVREPPGPQGHVRRGVHRRHDPDPRHARPHPGRHRQMTGQTGNGGPMRPTDLLTNAERAELIGSMRPEDAETVPELHEVDVPPELQRTIEEAMGRYPQLRSASIPALWAVQRHYGWCTPDGIRQAAAVMGVTPAYLQSVASFYDLFRLEPTAKHRVLVCHNISCWMRGADDILVEFCEASGCDHHEAEHDGANSPDGEVFIKGFECLGACDIAPMVSIDEQYYGPLEPGDAAEIVARLKRGEDPAPDKDLRKRPMAGGHHA